MELHKLFLFAILYAFIEAFQKPPAVLIHKDNSFDRSGKNPQANQNQGQWAANRNQAGFGQPANRGGAGVDINRGEIDTNVLKNILQAKQQQPAQQPVQVQHVQPKRSGFDESDNSVRAFNNNNKNNRIPNDIPEKDGESLKHQQHPQQQQNFPSHNQLPEKEHNVPQEPARGKSRVIWDWHDFSINMEDYVVPEQKIRRSPISTSGEPWPLPQYYIKKAKVLRLSPNFKFVYLKHSCDIIEHGIIRYRKYILQDSLPDLLYNNLKHARGFRFEETEHKYESKLYKNAPVIETIQIDIHSPCVGVFPSDKTDESYDLVVKESGSYLSAKQVWGALRALETLSQLVVKSPAGELFIKDVVIGDYPRFSHRGVMIDTSRHYLYKDVIFDVLEGMAQNKMNVLHWHMVDDQSFPYESKVFPELSEKGAYHPSMVYKHKDIAEIIQFARLRGIRIVPEFDNPGHTYSWGLGRPDLLTQCYERSRPVNGYLGPIDPTKNMSYTFLKKLLNEVLHVFKDKYIHLGGDEVPLTCWQSNPEVIRFAAHLTGTDMADDSDIHKVLEYYERRVINDLAKIGKRRPEGVRVILWQEVLNNNFQLPNDTIIQIWQGDMFDVERAAKRGHQIVYSTCWYLDLIEYGIKWPKYYTCDPADTSGGYDFEEKDVLGGEACLWAEYIDNEEIMSRLWPAASATAERLWSSKDVKDIDKAGRRLYEHRCRMLSRGLRVGQINGPDYCPRHGRMREYERPIVQEPVCEGCSKPVEADGLTFVAVFVVAALLGGVLVQYSHNGGLVGNLKACRSRTIMFTFMLLLLLYVMCYTTIWVRIMDLKRIYPWRQKVN